MISKFDYYRQIENPNMYLCNPDKRFISAVNAENRHLVLRFNDLSELTFTVHKNICKEEDYNRFATKRLIFLDNIGWFQIREASETVRGDEAYKEIVAESHQTVFKDRGFVLEDRVYMFFNPKDPYDDNYDADDIAAIPSVIGQLNKQLGIRFQANVSEPTVETDLGDWTIVYIDEGLKYSEAAANNICRTFEKKTTYGYDFMINDVESAFDVVFDFDILHHAIKIKFTSNVTTETDVYLSFENVVNNINVHENSEDIVTVLSCNGNNLDIRTVNPMGTNYICNFDYYKKEKSDDGKIDYPWMSKELIDALDLWEEEWAKWQEHDDSRTEPINTPIKESYSELVLDLQEKYSQKTKIDEKIQFANLRLNDLVVARDQYKTAKDEKMYAICDSSTEGCLLVVADSATPTSSEIRISDVKKTGLQNVATGKYVILKNKQDVLCDTPVIVETVKVGEKSKLVSGIGQSAYRNTPFTETSTITSHGSLPTRIVKSCLTVTKYKSGRTYTLSFNCDGTYTFTNGSYSSSGKWTYDLSKKTYTNVVCIALEQTSGSENSIFKRVAAVGGSGNVIYFKDERNNVDSINVQLAGYQMEELRNAYRYIANGKCEYIYSFNDAGTSQTAQAAIQGYNNDDPESDVYLYFIDDSSARSYCKLTVAAVVDVAVDNNGITKKFEQTGDEGTVTLKDVGLTVIKNAAAGSFAVKSGSTVIKADVTNGTYFNYPSSNGKRYRFTVKDGIVSIYLYYVSGFDRYTTPFMLTGSDGWCSIWESYIKTLDNECQEIDNEIAVILGKLGYINNKCNVEKFIMNQGAALYEELQYYWIEGDYENNNLSVLDNTTLEESIELAKELMEAGTTELEKVSQPAFTMTVDAIDFTKIFEYKKFADELELGKIITIEKDDDTHYRPALLSIDLDLDNAGSFSLTFSNAFKTNETAMTIADLLNESTSTSRTVAANWSNLTEYSRKKETIESLLKNPLDKTLRMAQANMANQEFTIDTTGILGRKYTDATQQSFDNEQLRIINNVIMFTDDCWMTSKLALGKIVYEDDGEEKTAYGLLAEVLVGDLIMGSTLKIKNPDSSVVIDEAGILIKHGDVDVFKADSTTGDLSIKGVITATGGSNFGVLSIGSDGVITSTTGHFSVDANGNLRASGSGIIGGFTIGNSSITHLKSSYNDNLNGVYLGTDGIGLGKNKFYIKSNGEGVIGSFSFNGSSLYNGVSSMDATGDGIYIGADGINLGGNFKVNKYGSMSSEKGSIDFGTINDQGYSQYTNINSTRLYSHTELDRPGMSRVEEYVEITPDKATFYNYSQDNYPGRYIYIGYLSEDTTGGATRYYHNSLIGTSTLKIGAYKSARMSSGEGIYILFTSTTVLGETVEKIEAKGNFLPLYGGIYDLGSETQRWDDVWITGGLTSTSDKALKTNIKNLSDDYDTLFNALNPVSFILKDGTSGRTHIGLIAQDLKEAISKAGLTTKDCAAYVEWTDEKGNTGCGIRYGELISLNIYEIQKLKKRITELENKLNEMQGEQR